MTKKVSKQGEGGKKRRKNKNEEAKNIPNTTDAKNINEKLHDGKEEKYNQGEGKGKRTIKKERRRRREYGGDEEVKLDKGIIKKVHGTNTSSHPNRKKSTSSKSPQQQRLIRFLVVLCIIVVTMIRYFYYYIIEDSFMTHQDIQNSLTEQIDIPKKNIPKSNVLESSNPSSRTTQNVQRPSPSSKSSSSLVIDILSIASINRLDYVRAQQNTFGLHHTVRYFHSVTELNDADPNCTKNLSTDDVIQISRWCKSTKTWDKSRQFVMKYLQGPYASENWLQKKSNPPGWMCAQSRPAQGLYDMFQRYYNQEKEGGRRGGGYDEQSLPDYLLVIDDDTYFNMEILQDYLQTHPQYQDSSKSIAMAGCLIRSPIKDIKLTVPFGGYGLLLSKGYLQTLTRPIDCRYNYIERGKNRGSKSATTVSNTTITASSPSSFTPQQQRRLCRTLLNTSHLDEASIVLQWTEEDDQIEKVTTAMSTTPMRTDNQNKNRHTLIDLLYIYATQQPYVQYKSWTVGFCVHSDWLFGIITNFYNIGRHNIRNNPVFEQVQQERLESYYDSEFYAGNLQNGFHGNCDYNYKADQCHSFSPVCHYATPSLMYMLHNITMSRQRQRQRQTTNLSISNKDKPEGTTNTTTTTPTASAYASATDERFVIDIVSIASTKNFTNQVSQELSFATHKNVRNFYPFALSLNSKNQNNMSTNNNMNNENIMVTLHFRQKPIDNAGYDSSSSSLSSSSPSTTSKIQKYSRPLLDLTLTQAIVDQCKGNKISKQQEEQIISKAMMTTTTTDHNNNDEQQQQKHNDRDNEYDRKFLSSTQKFFGKKDTPTHELPLWLYRQALPIMSLVHLLEYTYVDNDNENDNNDDDKEQRKNNDDNNNGNKRTINNLPDYLLILKDTTYFNVEVFREELLYRADHNWTLAAAAAASSISQNNNSNNNNNKINSNNLNSWALLGCMMKNEKMPFKYPMINMGVILNRKILQRLRLPLYCPSDNKKSYENGNSDSNNNFDDVDDDENFNNNNNKWWIEHVCKQILDSNRMGEKHHYRPGISLIHLLFQIATQQPTMKMKEDTNGSGTKSSIDIPPGLCFHDDWWLGYALDIYKVANEKDDNDEEGKKSDQQQQRVLLLRHHYHGMIPYAKSVHKGRKGPNGLCVNTGPVKCHFTAAYCSRISAELMMEYTREVRKFAPDQYKYH